MVVRDVYHEWPSTTGENRVVANIVVMGMGEPLHNVDNVIKYSLIVSIETTKTEIYDAVETAISNRIGVQIMQEV